MWERWSVTCRRSAVFIPWFQAHKIDRHDKTIDFESGIKPHSINSNPFLDVNFTYTVRLSFDIPDALFCIHWISRDEGMKHVVPAHLFEMYTYSACKLSPFLLLAMLARSDLIRRFTISFSMIFFFFTYNLHHISLFLLHICLLCLSTCLSYRSEQINKLCELRYHRVNYVTICICTNHLQVFAYNKNKYQRLSSYLFSTRLRYDMQENRFLILRLITACFIPSKV